MTLETVSEAKSHGGRAGRLSPCLRRDRHRHDLLGLPAAAGGDGRAAAGPLVSVGPDLHPRQCHRKGRVSRRLRRSTGSSSSRPTPARAARACPTIPRAPRTSAWAPASMSTRREEPWAAQLPHVDLRHRGAAGAGRASISRSTWTRQGITGHSMGGHGALTVALRHPGRFRSVSAFAPIVAPSQVPWGEKALAGYLGDGPRGVARA